MNDGPVSWSFTNYTRRSLADRRVIIQGFDVPMKGLLTGGISFVVGLIICSPFLVLFGVFGMIPLPFLIVGGMAALDRRSKAQLNMYQSAVDSFRASINCWCVGMRPVATQRGFVVQRSSLMVTAVPPTPGRDSLLSP